MLILENASLLAAPEIDERGEFEFALNQGLTGSINQAGALVVVHDGELVLYVERGGRSLLTWSDDPVTLQPAVDALALAVRDGQLGKLAVERADGEAGLTSPLGAALEQAGFRPTPRGLRLRA